MLYMLQKERRGERRRVRCARVLQKEDCLNISWDKRDQGRKNVRELWICICHICFKSTGQKVNIQEWLRKISQWKAYWARDCWIGDKTLENNDGTRHVRHNMGQYDVWWHCKLDQVLDPPHHSFRCLRYFHHSELLYRSSQTHNWFTLERSQ